LQYGGKVSDEVITTFNERILFVNHTFGLKYKKLTKHKQPRKYQKLSDIWNLNPRFKKPTHYRVYGNECYFNFCYLEDKHTGEWYTYPPSEIVVYATDVINKKTTPLSWVKKNHGVTNPFEIKVKNGQIWRRLQVWFTANDIGYKFRMTKGGE